MLSHNGFACLTQRQATRGILFHNPLAPLLLLPAKSAGSEVLTDAKRRLKRVQFKILMLMIHSLAWPLKQPRSIWPVTKERSGRNAVLDAGILLHLLRISSNTVSLLVIIHLTQRCKIAISVTNLQRHSLASPLLRYLHLRKKWERLSSLSHKSWGKPMPTIWLQEKPARRGGLWGIGCHFCAHLMHKLAMEPEIRKTLPGTYFLILQRCMRPKVFK